MMAFWIPSSYYNILVISTTSKVRLNLRNAFEAENHNVFESADQDEALVLAEGLLPDFIIVDIGSDNTGMEVVEALRNNEMTRSITLVVLGSHKELEGLEKFDVDLYLKKPIHGKRILSNIKSVLMEQNTGDELKAKEIQ